MLFLTRAYLPDNSATLGRWETETGFSCYTLELPWRNNERGRSCIPEGTYDLRVRESEVVHRTTGGEFQEGFEIVGVPFRTWIMVHPGNWAKDTNGCILVGKQFWWSDKGPMVKASRATFREFMKAHLALSGEDLLLRVTNNFAAMKADLRYGHA